jgi:hypothetical protein
MAHAAIPFDFTAGQSNRIINMNLGGPINGPVVENGVGLRLEIPGANTTPTPVMPPPGIPLTNSGGQAIAVNILGGRVTKVLAGNSTVCLATGCSVTISPGESITVDYTTKPSWVWRPIAY